MQKKTVRDIEVADRRVLVRVDFNVPLDRATGAILDDSRVRAALPTIRYLREHGARVILCSHLGRPRGVEEGLRLRPVARRLEELLGASVRFATDCVGPVAELAVASLGPGEVLLLDNLRFYAQEEKNDTAFARRLAALADVYVNDAFGAAHRPHASTAGIAVFLPAVAGLLMEKEVDTLTHVLSDPERPFSVVLGGAKVSDKIGVLNNLLVRADALLIGGGMANTFLKARGLDVGDSLVENEQLDQASRIAAAAADRGVQFLLPEDVVIADRFAADANVRTIDVGSVEPAWRIMDIGPRTVRRYGEVVRGSRLVLWNGPMGVFEFPPFAEGTVELARAVAQVSGTTIVGGGETVAAVEEAGVAHRISHISTGGGATLEFLEGKELPGVAALNDRDAAE